MHPAANRAPARSILIVDGCTLNRGVRFILITSLGAEMVVECVKSGDAMFQAEIGGAARVDPGFGLQRPGYLIRDFTLENSAGENIRISSFRGRANLLLVFPGYSEGMRAFLEDAARHSREFSDQEATLVAVIAYGPEEREILTTVAPSILVLHDRTHSAYRLSGALDEEGKLIPLVYLTDRFGEIVLSYSLPGNTMPPNVDQVLRTLEFLNHQCPECEPPEWPKQYE